MRRIRRGLRLIYGVSVCRHSKGKRTKTVGFIKSKLLGTLGRVSPFGLLLFVLTAKRRKETNKVIPICFQILVVNPWVFGCKSEYVNYYGYYKMGASIFKFNRNMLV